MCICASAPISYRIDRDVMHHIILAMGGIGQCILISAISHISSMLDTQPLGAILGAESRLDVSSYP